MTRKYWASCNGLLARRPGPARCIAAGLSASVGPRPGAGAAKLVLPSTPGQAPGLGADRAPVQRPGLQPATAAGRQVQARAGRWLECGKSSCAISWRTLMASGLFSYDQDPYVVTAGYSCGITDPRRTLMVCVTWGRTLMDSSRTTSTLWHHRRGLSWYHRSAEDSYAAPGRRSAGVHARAAKSGSAGSLTEKRGSCLSGAVADDRWQCRGLGPGQLGMGRNRVATAVQFTQGREF